MMDGGWTISRISTRQLLGELERREGVEIRRRKGKPSGAQVVILINEREDRP